MLTLICAALQRDGHQVDTESDTAAVQPERCRLYDLLLFDIMMPKEDGFSLLRRIRTKVDCPILFLTAKTGDSALVQGLGLGADDYIKKPFSIAELCVRVNAHLRREKRQPVPLTKGEYAICKYLALHIGQIFTKEQIYENVFGFDAEGDSSVIAMHIKNIRAKLKEYDTAPIETVWGWDINGKKKTLCKPFFRIALVCMYHVSFHVFLPYTLACHSNFTSASWFYLSWFCSESASRRISSGSSVHIYRTGR